MTAHLVPPQDVAAEEELLGGVLMLAASDRADRSERIGQLLQSIEPATFYRESHARIFRAVVAVHAHGEQPDVLAVAAELDRGGGDDLAGDRAMLTGLARLAPGTANLAQAAARVRDVGERRRIHRAGIELVDAALNGGLDDEHRERVRELLDADRVAGGLELEAMTARDICALPDPPVSDQLVGSFAVRKARTIVAGHTGDGKTSYSVALLKAAVHGDEFLGFPGTDDGYGLVLDLEQGLRTVKRVLRDAGLADSDRIDYVRVPDGLALNKATNHITAVERLLDARAYSVVLLDPFYKAHTGDANSEQELRTLLRLLDGWREHYGFALILPAHMRKPPDPTRRPTIHDISGHASIVQGAEVVLGIQRASDGYSFLHHFKDREGDLPVGERWRLLYDRERGYRRDPKDGVDRDIEADVLAHIADGAWHTARDVARPEADGGIGANEKTVKGILERLRSDGRAEFEKGPTGRNATALCYRLRGESGPLTHMTHLTLLEGSHRVGGSGALIERGTLTDLPARGESGADSPARREDGGW